MAEISNTEKLRLKTCVMTKFDKIHLRNE